MSSAIPHEIPDGINVRQGSDIATGLRVAIVVSRFNNMVTDLLLDGALTALIRAGASPQCIDVLKVPGAWEMPVLVGELARQKRVDAIVCLGCVVRGDTPHFDYVAGESARGINDVAVRTGIPVTNGILTTNTMDQALQRAGGDMGNKGAEAAMVAIEMVHLLREVRNVRG